MAQLDLAILLPAALGFVPGLVLVAKAMNWLLSGRGTASLLCHSGVDVGFAGRGFSRLPPLGSGVDALPSALCLRGLIGSLFQPQQLK